METENEAKPAMAEATEALRGGQGEWPFSPKKRQVPSIKPCGTPPPVPCSSIAPRCEPRVHNFKDDAKNPRSTGDALSPDAADVNIENETFTTKGTTCPQVRLALWESKQYHPRELSSGDRSRPTLRDGVGGWVWGGETHREG